MEASEALQTGQTAPEGQAEGTEAAEATQGPDFSPVLDRFNEVESGLNQRLDQFEQRLQPEPEEGEGDDGYLVDPRTGEYVDEYGQPVGEESQYFDPAEERDRLRDEIRREMRQEIQPLVEKFRDQDLAKIEEKYPELRNKESAEPVVRAAQAAAEQFGKPELLEEPGFIEMAYLAERARQSAAQETPAGAEQGGASLETGSGSRPEAEQQPGVFERLTNQRAMGSQERAFWGVS